MAGVVGEDLDAKRGIGRAVEGAGDAGDSRCQGVEDGEVLLVVGNVAVPIPRIVGRHPVPLQVEVEVAVVIHGIAQNRDAPHLGDADALAGVVGDAVARALFCAADGGIVHIEDGRVPEETHELHADAIAQGRKAALVGADIVAEDLVAGAHPAGEYDPDVIA